MKDKTAINYDKVLTKKAYDMETISHWVKAKGFDLSICTIHDHSLKLSLNVVYGTFEEFKKFMKKEFDQEIEHKNATAFFIQISKPECAWNFMLIQSNNWTAPDYGTICHELHHFTHFGLDEKGISYGSAGEEVYAYVQGYFMEMTVRAFVELHKVLKKKK